MNIAARQMLLFNWHYISNEQKIFFDTHCSFITGGNTAGKTTIMDAFLTAAFQETLNYNLANAAKGLGKKRSLYTYMRGKNNDSEEADDFIRKNEVHTHILIEFIEIETRRKFIVGFSASLPNSKGVFTNKDVSNKKWWYLEGDLFDEISLTVTTPPNNRRAKTFQELAKEFPEMVVWDKRETARRELSKIYGLTNAYAGDASCITRLARKQTMTLAYDPKAMKNISSFLSDQVFGPMPLEVESYNELADSFANAAEELRQTEEHVKKLHELVSLIEHYDETFRKKENNRIGALLLLEENAMERIRLSELKIEDLEQVKCVLEKEKHDAEEEYTRLNIELGALRNSDKSLEYEDKIRRLQKELSRAKQAEKNIRAFIKNAYETIDIARTHQHTVSSPFFEKHQAYQRYNGDFEDIQDFYRKLQEVYDTLMQESGRLKVESQMKTNALRELYEEQEALSKNRTTHRGNLLPALNKFFAKQGISEESQYLYQVLEIDKADESWLPALETYLGTQRYNIVVPPNLFQMAAQFVKENHFYNEVIMDLTNFDEQKAATPHTLPSVLRSSNPYVQQYMIELFSNVILCDDVTNVHHEKGKAYLDREGGRYFRRGLTKKKFVYTIIGENSRAQALDRVNKQIDTTRAEAEDIKQSISQKDHAAANINRLILSARLPVETLTESAKYNELSAKIEQLKMEMERAKDATLQEKISLLNTRIKCVDEERSRKAKEINDVSAKKTNEEANAAHYKKEQEEKSTALKRELESDLALAQTFVKKKKEKNRKKGLLTLGTECEQAVNGTNGIKDALSEIVSEIYQAEREFQSKFSAAAPTHTVEAKEVMWYRENYARLRNDKLQELRMGVDAAKTEVNRFFQRNVLSELHDQIRTTKQLINKINRKMEECIFNGRVFSLQCSANPAYQEYYDVIEHHLEDGEQINLFDLGIHKEQTDKNEEQRVLTAFFQDVQAERLVNPQNNKFLDYRTLCDFKIYYKSEGSPGKGRNYQDVVGEGSGSQVQIPCYLILATALYNMYEKKKNPGFRIMLVDEAFAAMETDNVKKMVQFITETLGLQLVLSAPFGGYNRFRESVNSITYLQTNKRSHTRVAFNFTSCESMDAELEKNSDMAEELRVDTLRDQEELREAQAKAVLLPD